ncbi:sugar phosphate isomerase/epimerase family protein [Microlunatus capsulatus]|uniref:Myo-inositol catabolism protein IolH n=1 Tax=Microlunatus capsulatus TaxID=99117 RepID=A0ABS4Z5N1_9ACTN|nr:sugar phosphate isomerase/epimerase family protein [Microlunatus capsulatus]MBP2416341.1 myo-inositol catabolism protein IolH [Microlunatus capsulatus]
MKLALDPQMFFATHRVHELPDLVASLGYAWMELSPKADFLPFFRHPRVDDAGVRRLRKVAADAGVGIASLLPVQRWSGPGEDERQAAVRAWRRTIQIAVDLGVDTLTSEFNGRPEAAEHAEAQFLRSFDELAPVLEREGISLVLEPHPDDFVEDGLDAVGLVRGLNRDWVGFLYCTPHAFHQGHDAATVIAAAAEKVRYVHLADAFDHTASHGLRYITNPPGNAVRVHQHMELGRGEVDHDAVFAALADVGFDGVVSSCVFGFEEDARGISERQRDKAVALIEKHVGNGAGTRLLPAAH